MTNYAIGSMNRERWIRKLKCLGLSKVPIPIIFVKSI